MGYAVVDLLSDLFALALIESMYQGPLIFSGGKDMKGSVSIKLTSVRPVISVITEYYVKWVSCP